jgi:hypothetical protein
MLKITGTMMLVLMLTTLTASAAWLTPTESDQSTLDASYLTAETTINGNGLRFVDFHNNNKTYNYPDTSEEGMMWLSETADVAGAWVAFGFDSPVTVETLTVWNFNHASDIEAGIKDFRILYTTDTTLPLASRTWTDAGTGTLDIATGLSYYKPNTSIDVATELPGLANVELTGIMLEVVTNYDSDSDHVGLSEIRFEGEVVPEPATMGLLAVGGLEMLRSRRRSNNK